jgi:hypothetical protein
MALVEEAKNYFFYVCEVLKFTIKLTDLTAQAIGHLF